MIRFVAIDDIFRQRALSPSVGSPYAVDVKVNIQVDEASTAYFVGMTHALKVLFPIIPGADAERLTTVDA